jgi:protein-disulfide isomerase
MQWVAGLVGLLAGGAAVAVATGAGAGTKVGDPDRASIEAVVRDYILNHPEIIPEAMTRLQWRETAKLLAMHRAAIETPFAGAWAGAKDGNVTLVMFTDYSCGYCRTSVPHVDRLLAEDSSPPSKANISISTAAWSPPARPMPRRWRRSALPPA